MGGRVVAVVFWVAVGGGGGSGVLVGTGVCVGGGIAVFVGGGRGVLVRGGRVGGTVGGWEVAVGWSKNL
jgi:hypothetical protein